MVYYLSVLSVLKWNNFTNFTLNEWKNICLFYTTSGHDSKIISDYSRRRRASPLKLPHWWQMSVCALILSTLLSVFGVLGFEGNKIFLVATLSSMLSSTIALYILLTYVGSRFWSSGWGGWGSFSGATGFRLSLTLSLSLAFGMTALKLSVVMIVSKILTCCFSFVWSSDLKAE